jgi:hypothetical protein
MDRYSNDDKTGMKIISLFAASVPTDLGRRLRNDFEDGYFELSKLFYKYKDISPQARNFIFTALAISVYYLNIIVPIKSANSFYDRLSSRHEIKTIKFGEGFIDKNRSEEINSLLKYFNEVVEYFYLNTYLLSYNSYFEFFQKMRDHIANLNKRDIVD